LPRLEYFQNGVLLTGASGFLGSHIVNTLRGTYSSVTADADVRKKSVLQELAGAWRADIVLHLASKGTVLTPLDAVPELLDVAVDGLIHLLACFSPRVMILPSSCAVYGETGLTPVLPSVSPSPLSVYGLSKAVCERALGQWVTATGQTGIILRLGNLVGPGGRGLIGYLVDHAVRYPDGSTPARMRGGGRLVRDYVPIEYVVRVMLSLFGATWEPGRMYRFNVGSGKPRSNGQVAAIVQRTLRDRGISLDIHYDEQPGTGEARRALMNTRETEEHFGLRPPEESDIDNAIRRGVTFQLESAKLTLHRKFRAFC
jgi:UDP-glucose 4-epimerase